MLEDDDLSMVTYGDFEADVDDDSRYDEESYAYITSGHSRVGYSVSDDSEYDERSERYRGIDSDDHDAESGIDDPVRQ